MVSYIDMKILLKNRRASFDYEILEKYEAGISLLGFEVKSLRNSQGSINEAYVIERGNELFLVGAYIPPYQTKNTPAEYDPYQARKLLLTKGELEKIKNSLNEKGLTIIPTMVYTTARLLKIQIAIVRGKKKHDKRNVLKKKAENRDLEREIKNR